MSTTLQQLVDGIETRLATVTDLRIADYTPEQVNPPTAWVMIPPIENYRASFGRGYIVLEPVVRLVVSAAYSPEGQKALVEFAEWDGPRSIPAAFRDSGLETTALGGLVDQCWVKSFSGEGLLQVGALQYIGGTFTLGLIVQGKD